MNIGVSLRGIAEKNGSWGPQTKVNGQTEIKVYDCRWKVRWAFVFIQYRIMTPNFRHLDWKVKRVIDIIFWTVLTSDF